MTHPSLASEIGCRFFGIRQRLASAPRTTRCVLATMLVLSTLANLAQAAELLPPLQALRSPTFTVVSAERTDTPMVDRRISLQVLEVLRGPAPTETEIQVQALPHEDRLLAPGARYLVVYNEVERVSFKPRKQVRRPHNRQLVRVDGASPAVFLDSPTMRGLLAPEHREIEVLPTYRDTVLSNLRTDDAAMLDLWTAELALRPGTFAELQQDEIEAIQTIVADPQAPATTRSRLLMTAFARAPAFGSAWYIDAAVKLLQTHDPEAQTDSSGLSELIYNAMVVLHKHPRREAAPALRHWLRASPPLAENAAWGLRAIDPSLERDAVVEAIASELTPEATRRMLEDYLRRLDLRQAKLSS